MNVDIAKKWVAALRSGEYRQGRGMLETPKGHCCLGVLCDLAVKEGVIVADRGLDPDGIVYYDAVYTLPSDKVAEWAGVGRGADGRMGWTVSTPSNFAFGDVEWARDRISLAALNDSGEFTFDEIADLIEKEYVNADA